MKIAFWGGAGTVTGSKYFVTSQNENVLVDCGLFQGLKDLRLKNWDRLLVDSSAIQAVILTHAHLDHCGYLPLLVKNGFRGKIFATPATTDLCRIMLLDSAYLQEEEAKFANGRGFSKHKPALPLYTRADAQYAMTFFVATEFRVKTKVSETFSFEYFSAGHLLGAASVRLEAKGRSILFSGDLGRASDPITVPPEIPHGADILVVESTYGNRSHSTVNPESELRNIVNRTIERGGTVLIPTFAAGRAQLILYYLKELKRRGEIPAVPVYLNSPMANSVNAVFRKHPESHRLSREEAIQVCQTADVIATPEESIALNEDLTPKIILAASGMATGGRVLHHLKSLAPHSLNSIVFAGFQAAGTRGDAIVNGKAEIKIHGELWPVRAEVVSLDCLSGHADANEIVKWTAGLDPQPKKIFVTHGESRASESLAARLRSELRVEVSIPEMMSELVI